MRDFPVFGVGVGAWGAYNKDYGRSPHNEFLEYGAMGGIPVLISYVLIFVYCFIKFRKNIKKQEGITFVVFGAIIAYLVSSFFGCLMPSVLPVFYIMLGFMIKLTDENQDENKLNSENIKVD